MIDEWNGDGLWIFICILKYKYFHELNWCSEQNETEQKPSKNANELIQGVHQKSRSLTREYVHNKLDHK